MRLVVLADIHANATALKAALKIADNKGYDRIVFLGDLLTYGVDIEETLELVYDRLMRQAAILIRGNHDALYQDLLNSGNSYYNLLPTWIRESVDWTMCRIPLDLWFKLEFKNEFVVQKTLLSHANPYGYPNWQYLNTNVECANAVEELRAHGLDVGVFGHTHRAKWFRSNYANSGFILNQSGTLDCRATHILNAGSVGQSREIKSTLSSLIWINIPDDFEGDPDFEIEYFSWDVGRHVERLKISNMSRSTLIQLGAFFEGSYFT